MATSRKPSEPRKRTASSSLAPSTSVRCTRFISPVSAIEFGELGERAARARAVRVIARTTPMRAHRLAVALPANQRPVSSSQIFSPLPRRKRVLHLIGNAAAGIAHGRSG